MSNSHVAQPFADVLNAWAEEDRLIPCANCGDFWCDGYYSAALGGCPKHPDRVSAREARAESDARWNSEFGRGQDAGKYGEE